MLPTASLTAAERSPYGFSCGTGILPVKSGGWSGQNAKASGPDGHAAAWSSATPSGYARTRVPHEEYLPQPWYPRALPEPRWC
jgi:hypothetical protein